MHTLEELKQHSILISPIGTVVCWPQTGNEETIYPTETVSKFNGRFYAANNSTVAFIDGQDLFVTPYTRAAMAILEEASYEKVNFWVPFSNWEYPKYAAERWTDLRKWAHQTYLEDYVHDCNEWSDQHGYGAISDETLLNTLRAPETGIPFHSPRGYDDTYYGECPGAFLDAGAVMKIGTFCRNNGVVAFVYRDGNTYLARGYRITTELANAGYKEHGFFVPLSNGETITDTDLAGRWASLKRA